MQLQRLRLVWPLQVMPALPNHLQQPQPLCSPPPPSPV
jgi:hypothetical protein